MHAYTDTYPCVCTHKTTWGTAVMSRDPLEGRRSDSAGSAVSKLLPLALLSPLLGCLGMLLKFS